VTLAPLLQASPAIQIHAFAAMGAFMLGAVQRGRRRAPFHLLAIFTLVMLPVAGLAGTQTRGRAASSRDVGSVVRRFADGVEQMCLGAPFVAALWVEIFQLTGNAVDAIAPELKNDRSRYNVCP
jgi:hypothetical protein